MMIWPLQIEDKNFRPPQQDLIWKWIQMFQHQLLPTDHLL